MQKGAEAPFCLLPAHACNRDNNNSLVPLVWIYALANFLHPLLMF